MITPITSNIIRGTTIESMTIHHWKSEDESLGVCATVEVLDALEAETERSALAAYVLKLETSDVEPLAEIIVSAAGCLCLCRSVACNSSLDLHGSRAPR